MDCGKIVKSLPLQCGYSITVNPETNQWECFMENCGIISFDEFICENCCINRRVMKLSKGIEKLSLENSEFSKELEEIKKVTLQFNLVDSDFKYWVEFGGGG